MFEQLAIEQTPVAVQIYTQSYFEAPRTANPVNDRRAPVIAPTRPSFLKAPVVENTVARTATLADMSDRRHSKASAKPTITVDHASVLEKTRNDRVTLLAQKYAGKINSEANARLEILTARLNQLVPTVEAATLERVAEVASVAQKSNPRIAALKSKYNV